MKKNDIVTGIFARKPYIVVAYLGVSKETKRNEAPKKGQGTESFIAKHQFLWAGKTWEVTKWANSQKELDDIKPIAPEFTVLCFEVESMEETKWGNRASGEIFSIEA